ncbi:leucine-rich repeat-containing protein 41 isoform X2 [Polyodon spathula]|uniref:leucine-rich repeat-containing protein 41 isoform X2 n=1 Tax=Polyodon spathula TaxID=7913 RepID=UPI001B7DFCE1|nr:leucine-rich repeat-containing protein 41 isoform X2 [Polyodon spathula]
MTNEDKPQSLVKLCAKSVCKDMGRLEQQVWDLPASLIEELLPFLNIFYLERIEEVAVRKGLSTASVWLRIWMEVVKYKPLGSKPVKDWRQKFLEYLFHCVLLRKSLAEDNPRLQDPRFSALTLGARYVQRLTLSSHPYGAVRLATDELRPILEILQGTVTQLKLHHFSQRPHEASMKSITLLLHRLIHHGSVHTLTIINCDKAIPFILIRVLRMSAGQLDLEMRDDLGVCFCCDRESDVKLQANGQQRRCRAQQERETVATTKDSGKNSSRILKALPLQEGKGAANSGKRLSDNKFCTTNVKWPRLEQGVEAGECFNTLEPSTEGTPAHTATPQSSQALGGERILFRSITALEVDLSSTIIPELQALLPSWVSLCSLDLFGNRFSEKSDLLKVVAALRSLCQHPEGSISALSIDSVFCPMPITAFMVNLLSTCPKLETLSLNFDVEEEDRLSPPQPIPVFLSVLRIAQSLQHLHLSWTSNQGFGTLLLTLIESNPNLCWLTLKGANLSACQKEVICFLKNSSLQGVDFTDCRLFEKNKVEFLGKLVDAVKGSKTLKFLHLPKNRLGNKGLVTLAELFSGNPTSQIEHLNISANCILPDGLLEFGRLLEQHPPSSRLLLDLRQNPLDRDPGTAQQAMELLRRRCQVVGDMWNSRAAFADYASVM